MKLMTFSEINDLENGQQVSSFQGTIKKVFDQKTGEGNYGTWWLQNIILQDDHANELTVTWGCPDPFDAGCEGTKYLFEAGHDKKDQLVGLKREIRNKNGKTYESVKVDDRAKVKALNGATAVNEPEDQISDQQRTVDRMFPKSKLIDRGDSDPEWPEAPANAPGAPTARSNDDAGVQEARAHLMKGCNLYNLCIKAAVASICPNIPEEQRTSDQFQSTLASLWIEASGRRSTDGNTWWSYIDKMPTKPL